MSLPDLAAVLWRQRELLERLVYRLECEQLLLAAGRTRFLPLATAEVEALIDDLSVVEMQRAAIADAVAVEVGLDAGARLEELAAAAEPPWTGVLIDHRNALLTLTGELTVLAETNRHMMAAGLAAVEQAMAGLGLRDGRTSVGYDAQGRQDVIAGAAATVVDRSL
ncbi:MAG: flagellar export chaperone FlgN [Kineosporiaceae bacterium]|nr:flagellar export chaperone FlgN [Kineosporiaceae bacterium]MBK7622153.1 flagellar export chaperone FlgN [Kineosporiaceae bacterium]MBK8074464.1 flagellar export chaperone FlgN [Kineosporiaceae bacterium]